MRAKHVTLLVLAAIVIASPFFFPSNYYYRVGSLIFVNGLAVTGIVILTGIYVRRANSEFDEMTEELVKEVK